MSVEINVTDQIVEIEVAAGASVQPTWGAITGTLSNQTDLQNALDAKVPYSGATGNVNLGEYELKAGQLTLDTSPTGTATVATMRWNDTTGLTETTLKGGNVVLKNGVDLVARVVNKVSPNTTLTKAAYQAVRVSGAQGQRLAVSFAQANNDNNSADTIGLVTETIATNQEGFIMTVGQLEGINTTGSLQGETWVDGDVLYLSPTTAGALTNVKPVAPQHLVIIGYVEYAHANNGKIYVKVMNGWELGELHDVNTTGATNGSVLKYNGSIWVPSSDTGITTLNTLTALSQSFATGTSGTDFNISSATSTHTFNLPSASATNRGLLTSADWTTFNNKQNALTNPITGTGTSGQVAYFTGATTQSGSNNLFWDAANSRLGIGTNTPTQRLEVNGSGLIGTVLLSQNTPFITGSNVSSTSSIAVGSSAGFLGLYSGNSVITFNTNSNERMRIFAGGNVAIGSISDNGQRLQVTGDGYFSGSVGIGTSSLTGVNLRISKTLTGSTSPIALYIDNTIQSDATNSPSIFGSTPSTQAAAFTIPNLYHYSASMGTIGAGSAITNQYGFIAQAGLIGATNNFGFYGNIAAATGRWNLYMNGTAANYLAGSLGIGVTAPATKLEVSVSGNNGIRIANSGNTGSDFSVLDFVQGGSQKGVIYTNNDIMFVNSSQLRLSSTGANPMLFSTNGTERMRLDASGNLGLGVTPSAWLNAIRGFDFGARGALYAVDDTNLINNAFINSSGNWVYKAGAGTLSGASRYFQYNGIHQWFTAPSGTAGNTITFTQAMTLFATGNLSVGTTADAGFRLDVNGTMRVSGASTFNANMALTLNHNAATFVSLTNSTSGTGSEVSIRFNSNSGVLSVGKYSTTTIAYKTLAANDAIIFNSTADISILNDNSTGAIKLTAGGSSTVQWTIGSNGDLTAADGENIIVGTTNGTKLGTATSQKIGFWNATPIVQPTTAVAAAAFVANTGTAVNDASTFDGYTMAQIVKALRNAGLLA